MKLRPVLLPTGSVGPIPQVLVACISSVIRGQLLPSDVVVDPSRAEFQNTHLKVISTLRLHKIANIHCSSLVRLRRAPDRLRAAVLRSVIATGGSGGMAKKR